LAVPQMSTTWQESVPDSEAGESPESPRA